MVNVHKKRLKWFLLFSLVMMIAATGCSSKSSNSGSNASASGPAATPADTSASASSASPEPSKLDAVELIWYYPQPKSQPDLQAVNEAVNKITEEKINATVKLQPVDFANYEEKMNTIVASGETFDILWTASWGFDWVPNQKKGAFQPLDDLLQQYGQKLFASMPEKFWNDAKMDGKIWAVPSYQIAARRPSFVIQKQYIDKYKLDISTIKKPADLEPFLKQIKDNEPGVIPFGSTGGFFDDLLFGIDPFVPVHIGDSTNTVIDKMAVPEYKQYLDMVRSWYKSGYINKDAATNKELANVVAKGNVAAWYDYTGQPGAETSFKNMDGGKDVVLVPLMQAYFTGSSSTMNAISRTSKNPERAMMFMELVNTDKELYNLITYGLEGKHYTKLSGEFIKINPDGGYNPNTDWVFGNTTNGYLPEGAPADKFERMKQVNDEAIVSPYYGFTFDTEPVKTEYANVTAVDDEYMNTLGSGTVDPNVYLPKYQEKSKNAGNDKIIAEKQRQLNEFLKNKGQ